MIELKGLLKYDVLFFIREEFLSIIIMFILLFVLFIKKSELSYIKEKSLILFSGVPLIGNSNENTDGIFRQSLKAGVKTFGQVIGFIDEHKCAIGGCVVATAVIIYVYKKSGNKGDDNKPGNAGSGQENVSETTAVSEANIAEKSKTTVNPEAVNTATTTEVNNAIVPSVVENVANNQISQAVQTQVGNPVSVAENVANSQIGQAVQTQVVDHVVAQTLTPMPSSIIEQYMTNHADYRYNYLMSLPSAYMQLAVQEQIGPGSETDLEKKINSCFNRVIDIDAIEATLVKLENSKKSVGELEYITEADKVILDTAREEVRNKMQVYHEVLEQDEALRAQEVSLRVEHKLLSEDLTIPNARKLPRLTLIENKLNSLATEQSMLFKNELMGATRNLVNAVDRYDAVKRPIFEKYETAHNVDLSAFKQPTKFVPNFESLYLPISEIDIVHQMSIKYDEIIQLLTILGEYVNVINLSMIPLVMLLIYYIINKIWPPYEYLMYRRIILVSCLIRFIMYL